MTQTYLRGGDKRMRRFSIFPTPFYAFFSRDLYQDVGNHWRAVCFGYLFYLLAIAWIPTVIGMFFSWADFLDNDAPAITQQIPAITIENGRVSADVDQPYFIHSTETDEVFAIIDTTGQINSLDNTSAVVLVTSSALISKKSDAETRVYDLSEVEHFYMDQTTLDWWLELSRMWGPIIIYPFMLAGSYVYRLLQLLFYSLIALLLGKALNSSLGYDSILSITAVAITPAVILKTLAWMIDITMPFSWLVYFLVAFGYIAFGIMANQKTPSEPAPAFS